MNFARLVVILALTLFRPAYAGSSYHLGQLEIEKAWKITKGRPEVKVALISSGVNYRLPEIIASIDKNRGESGNGYESDGIDNDQNGYIDDVIGVNTRLMTGNPLDKNNVGTFEASIVASENYGIAPKVKLIPISVFDDKGVASWQDLLKAIEYAKNRGASLIYLGVEGSGAGPSLRTELCKAIKQAEVLVIAPAGNESQDLGTPHTWRFPVDCVASNLLTVASSLEDSSLASYSNYSFSKVHLAAPGDGVIGLDRYGRAYQVIGGTVSSSLVVGAAALVLSAHPEYTSYHLKEALMIGNDLIPTLADKVMSGGRVNAFKAITASVQ